MGGIYQGRCYPIIEYRHLFLFRQVAGRVWARRYFYAVLTQELRTNFYNFFDSGDGATVYINSHSFIHLINSVNFPDFSPSPSHNNNRQHDRQQKFPSSPHCSMCPLSSIFSYSSWPLRDDCLQLSINPSRNVTL